MLSASWESAGLPFVFSFPSGLKSSFVISPSGKLGLDAVSTCPRCLFSSRMSPGLLLLGETATGVRDLRVQVWKVLSFFLGCWLLD